MSKKEKIFPINTVGGRIQKMRHEMNLSRCELYDSVYKNETSELLNSSSKEKTVYNWESGKTELNYATLCTLCKTLQCSSDYLLGLEECSNKNAQFIYNETGLSETSQKRLHEIKLTPEQGKVRLFILNNLIENIRFSIALTDDINNCYSNYDNLQERKESLDRQERIVRNIHEKAQGDVTKEIIMTQSLSEHFIIREFKQQFLNACDSYDASLFRIQGKFRDIINDLIQTSYQNNSNSDIPPFIPFE